MEVHRGEVFYADLSPVVGSEQAASDRCSSSRTRSANRMSPTVIAAAITSRLDKARLPTHINIRADTACHDSGAAGTDPARWISTACASGPADHARGSAPGESGTGCQPLDSYRQNETAKAWQSHF